MTVAVSRILSNDALKKSKPAGAHMPVETIPTILAFAFGVVCTIAGEILLGRNKKLPRRA
jgi:hypothetical protein